MFSMSNGIRLVEDGSHDMVSLDRDAVKECREAIIDKDDVIAGRKS